MARRLELRTVMPHVEFVRYEDLLETPFKTIRAIAERNNIDMRPTFKMDGHYYVGGVKTGQFRRYSFYKDKRYMEVFDEAALQLVREQLDAEIETTLGYTLI
jgi:hypothetical protein